MAARELDDDADDVPFRDPPPTDDRLWRHPSELDAPPSPATAADDGSSRRGRLRALFSRQR